MGTIELFLLGVGLSMDAFAVSICKGLGVKEVKPKHMLCCGLWFGGFQALMPLIGYLLGSAFESYITKIDHWIAFVLLVFIGVNMIREALSDEEEQTSASFSFKTMLFMAIATSIDALAVGITFVFLGVNIGMALTLIGCTTFVFSAAGVKIGNVFGKKYQAKAEIVGGVILIAIGCKILMEHLFF